jgi:hypothetical protein
VKPCDTHVAPSEESNFNSRRSHGIENGVPRNFDQPGLLNPGKIRCRRGLLVRLQRLLGPFWERSSTRTGTVTANRIQAAARRCEPKPVVGVAHAVVAAVFPFGLQQPIFSGGVSWRTDSSSFSPSVQDNSPKRYQGDAIASSNRRLMALCDREPRWIRSRDVSSRP